MVTLDAPTSFTVVALGISSQISVLSMAITFAIAYCFVCSLFLGFAEVSSSAFFWHHSRILLVSTRNFRAAASLPLLSA